ncbi:unnamed protein product, partial [Iphiclides podalirius]
MLMKTVWTIQAPALWYASSTGKYDDLTEYRPHEIDTRSCGDPIRSTELGGCSASAPLTWAAGALRRPIPFPQTPCATTQGCESDKNSNHAGANSVGRLHCYEASRSLIHL